jgi:formiminotetrahydrofolate cyclodeaminase
MAENGLASLGIGEFLQRLASGTPTPGGGAASSLGGALGAALVSMVCNLTIGRERFAEHEAGVEATRQAAVALLNRLRAGIDEDAAVYDALMATHRLPRGTDEEKAARTAAIQEATYQAALVPLALAEASASVIDLAERALGKTNPHAVSDLAVAALLGIAGLDGAAANVEVNLSALKDVGRVSELSGRLAAVRAGRREQADRIVERARG